MRTAATILATMLAMATVSWGAPGDLTWVDKVGEQDGLPVQPTFIMARDIGQPEADSGTVHPKAVVASFTLGGRAMAAAIDAKAADAKAPDLIRFDVTGKGKFSDRDSLPLTPRQTGRAGMILLEFGPGVIKIQDDGRTTPVVIQGMYYKFDDDRGLQIRASVVAQGQCRFGKQTLPVRVVEGTGNLKIDDQAKVSSGRVRTVPAGDHVLIKVGDGALGETRTALLGQLVRIDGTWYRLRADQAAMKVRAEAVEVKGGKVRTAHDHWSATLVGKQNCLSVAGGKEPIDVPADEYVIVDYTETASEGDGGRGVLRRGGQRELMTGKARTFDVPAGKTVELAVGSPIKAEVTARVTKRTVTFSLAVSDASGAAIDYAMNAKGKRVPEPSLLVEDADGKEVYRCTLEYG